MTLERLFEMAKGPSQKFLENLAANPRFGLMPGQRQAEVGAALEYAQSEAKGFTPTPSGEYINTKGFTNAEKQAIKSGGIEEWQRRFGIQVGADKTWVRKADVEKALENADEETKVRVLEGEEAWRQRYGVKVGTDKDDWISKSWYDTLPDVDKAELNILGTSAFMDKNYVKIGSGGSELVRKEWFESLKSEEQNEIMAKGLKGTGYELFEVVGPAKELLLKSVIAGLPSAEYMDKLRELGVAGFNKWVGEQQLSYDEQMASLGYVKVEPLGEYIPREYVAVYQQGLNWKPGEDRNPYSYMLNTALQPLFDKGMLASEGWKEYVKQQKAEAEAQGQARQTQAGGGSGTGRVGNVQQMIEIVKELNRTRGGSAIGRSGYQVTGGGGALSMPPSVRSLR